MTLGELAALHPNRNPALADKIARALVDLGDTPDLVAASLEAQGCHRRPGKLITQHCPVAVYLQQVTGDPRMMMARSLAGRLMGTPDQTAVEAPPAVVAFVRAFDDGQYPALGRR